MFKERQDSSFSTMLQKTKGTDKKMLPFNPLLWSTDLPALRVHRTDVGNEAFSSTSIASGILGSAEASMFQADVGATKTEC